VKVKVTAGRSGLPAHSHLWRAKTRRTGRVQRWRRDAGQRAQPRRRVGRWSGHSWLGLLRRRSERLARWSPEASEPSPIVRPDSTCRSTAKTSGAVISATGRGPSAGVARSKSHRRARLVSATPLLSFNENVEALACRIDDRKYCRGTLSGVYLGTSRQNMIAFLAL
jgi:hypothetical protein